MNRLKQYELQQYQEKRRGRTAAEIEELDQAERQEMENWKVVLQRHQVDWGEEYEFMFDSIADCRDWAAGINPMSKEYKARVKHKRAELEVSQLAQNGLPTLSDDTWTDAYQKV